MVPLSVLTCTAILAKATVEIKPKLEKSIERRKGRIVMARENVSTRHRDNTKRLENVLGAPINLVMRSRLIRTSRSRMKNSAGVSQNPVLRALQGDNDYFCIADHPDTIRRTHLQLRP